MDGAVSEGKPADTLADLIEEVKDLAAQGAELERRAHELSEKSVKILTAFSKLARNNKVLSEEYVQLWNVVLSDGIIEIEEVFSISEWLAANKRDLPEFENLERLCADILKKRSVSKQDEQSLYDDSFALLKSLGAKVRER